MIQSDRRYNRAALHILLVMFICPVVFSQTMEWDSTGLAVCTANGWQRNPRITSDGLDGALIVWEDIRMGSSFAIYGARLRADGTLPWTADGIVISGAASGQTLGGIAPDGSGGAYVTWWNRKTGDHNIYAQHIGGDGKMLWQENGITVCSASRNQQWADIIPDGSGGAIIAWQDSRGSDNDIYIQNIKSDGSAAWNSDGILVTGAGGAQNFPGLSGDGLGGAYVVWMDKRNDDDIYAQYVRADGSVAWPGDLPVAVYPNRQLIPKIVSTTNHGAAMVWQDYRSSTTVSAIYMQVVDTLGTPLYTDGYRLAESPESQSGIYFTPDGSGGAMASWTDFRNGQNDGDVYMGRILPDGTIPSTSSTYGQPICTLTGTAQEVPQLVSDSAGGAFVVWQDRRNGNNYDLYMNRISANGLTSYAEWDQDGLPLIKADRNQLTPQVLQSGRGSAIIVWTDGRIADGQADIYAQRVAYAPWLSADTDTLDYGISRLNRQYIDSLTLTNTGAVPLIVRDIRRPPVGTGYTDYRIQSRYTFPFTVPVDSSFTVLVSWIPRSPGERTTQIHVNSSYSKDPVVFHLKGIGTDPKISVLNSFIFGAVKIGQSRDTLIEECIQNVGSGILLITGLNITGTNSSEFELPDLPPVPILVPSYEKLSLKVRFTPGGDGSRVASIKVHNNSDDSLKQINLRGAGGNPIFNHNPLVLHFNQVSLGSTSSKNISIINTGGVDLVISDLQVEGEHAESFSIDPFSGLTIPGNRTAPVRVHFSPKQVGTLKAKLKVISDDPRSPQHVNMDGIGEEVNAVDGLSAVDGYVLSQNYPNPFRAGSGSPLSISFAIPESAGASIIRLDLFDVLGGNIRNLYYDRISPGSHTHTLGPEVTRKLLPGIYSYRLTASEQRRSRIVLSRILTVLK